MARQRWGRRIEFFLTTVGFSIGVMDLWRFPFLVMKNGGGAFLIPIVIFNVLCAMPIVYLEMIMGQYSQSGSISVWRVCPIFKGVGYGTVIATFFFSIYYAVIIAWMLLYFVHSLYPRLPWASCDNEWNIKETCIDTVAALTSNVTATTWPSNVTSVLTTIAPTFSTVLTNTTISEIVSFGKKETAAEQFFKHKAMMLSEGLEVMGTVNWPLFGCLAAIEVLCFFCIFKGVKLSGKVVYFTVLAPFVMLFIFLVRGCILPGALDGIKYYVTPDLEKLKDTKIWAEACMHVFVSIGPGSGAMITFASYNKLSNNCVRDAVLVCLLDLLTGFTGGFVIFSLLGHVAYRSGLEVSHFQQSGFGLGFIAYPEAANYLPPPQLWCALFFFMSVFLGIDSQFPQYEIVVTAMKDEFPRLFKDKTFIMTIGVIILAFLLAIPMVTEGGLYLLTLVDWYAATFSVVIFALIELIVMAYIYGVRRVDQNVFEMSGQRVPMIVKICWYFLTPPLLLATLAMTVYTYVPPAYKGYVYKPWAVGLGWVIAATSLVPIPMYAIYILYRTPGTLLEKLKVNLRPNELWGPPADVRENESKLEEYRFPGKEITATLTNDTQYIEATNGENNSKSDKEEHCHDNFAFKTRL